MKRLILLLLCCALLCGCQPSTPTDLDDQAAGNSVTTGDDTTTEDTTDTSETTQTTEAATDESERLQTVIIYHAYGVTYFECEEVTPEFLIEKLIEIGILNQDVAINSYYFEDDTLYLDFNAAFADQINSYGTSGESITVNCMVNTFVENYHIPYVMFTVEGEIFESGHVIYDFPLGFTA